MHIYIYDSFVNQKKYDSVLARIETRITDLGLNGKIIRLGVMKSVHEYIENEVRKGAKSIIAVGNNHLLNQVINSMAKLASFNILTTDIPAGIIPIGKKNNELADFLGIDHEEDACNILSARRIEKLDLGLANHYYFLSLAKITSTGTTIKIDNNYMIEVMEQGEIGVVNLPVDVDLPKNVKSNATDSVMELYIKINGSKKYLPIGPQKTKQSIFSFNKLTIINKHEQVFIDNTIKIPSPVDITVAKEKINLIVSKNRKF